MIANENIKQKKSELEKLNFELKRSHDKATELNEELSAANEHLFFQKNELKSTIDKLKKAQSQLVLSEKMASIEILTSGFAHVINNPLNFIKGAKFAIESYIEDNHKDYYNDLKPLLDIIQQGIDRASSIVSNLNRFHRKRDVLIEKSEYLKSQIEISHIPIILLTAKASQDDKITGYEQGADDYIAKPFDEKELVLKVHNMLSIWKKQKEKYSKNITINSSEIVATSIDEQLLQQIVLVIEQNISNTDFSIDQLCAEVGLSRRNMFRKLKALADMKPSQFIRTIRLKRAAQLLSQKAGSVSEIAYQTGFDHLSYFTKCFKETYQKLPSEYV